MIFLQFYKKKKPEKKGKQTNLASKHLSLFSSEKNRCRKRFQGSHLVELDTICYNAAISVAGKSWTGEL